MLRLLTLGGVSLARESEPLTGAATQRRRLAILALLAVAGERGLSRDKLIGYLWPETEQERARHVLNQLIYAQRRHFESDALFLGKKTLRLNPEAITSDVQAFETAIASDQLASAVGFYQGPFLDGFFLQNAPEFDAWSDDQRRRLARRCASALATLAERASARGDHGEAVEWWSRATAHDPLNGPALLGLIAALDTAANRPAALHAARAFEARLRTEVGVEPDAALRLWIERLSRGN